MNSDFCFFIWTYSAYFAFFSPFAISIVFLLLPLLYGLTYSSFLLGLNFSSLLLLTLLFALPFAVPSLPSRFALGYAMVFLRPSAGALPAFPAAAALGLWLAGESISLGSAFVSGI